MQGITEIKKTYNPNEVGQKGSIFGLPFGLEDSWMIFLPVAWEATVSYHDGTAEGPAAILEPSSQIDLFQPDMPNVWQSGMFMLPVAEQWQRKSDELRADVAMYLEALENGEPIPRANEVVSRVNEASAQLNEWVYESSLKLLKGGKLIGLIGGDHSTPYGLIKALAEVAGDFGILHIDAHADLRKAYEGFDHSHASIMYNVLQLPEVNRLVQVGVRDLCQEEAELIQEDKKIKCYFDGHLHEQIYRGKQWHQLCEEIVSQLPAKVYISLDIDGLDPSLCPATGTPVPGGLSYQQLVYLLKVLAESGRTIIGFDLVEVAPGKQQWDENVAARLYRMAGMTIKSQGRRRRRQKVV